MFFLPLFDNNPTLRRPLITWLVMALCIAGFVWQETLDRTAAHNIVYQLGFIPAILFTPASLPENMILVPEWGTIFTSMFLHGGWLHMVSNMLYLWIFGDNIEAAMGRGRFILFYLLCGGAAAMAQAALDPSSTIPMIGASGGIAGVLGAYLLLHPKAAIRCFFLILIFFRFINLPAWLVLGVWIGGQFVAVPQAFADSGGGVAYMAHIGGFFAGMALIPLFKYRHVALFDRDVPPQNWSDRPLNFEEVKAEARARYHRSVSLHGQNAARSADAPERPPASSVPSSGRRSKSTADNDRPAGPWG
jgi:membrane associated rhomboid family serine protease